MQITESKTGVKTGVFIGFRPATSFVQDVTLCAIGQRSEQADMPCQLTAGDAAWYNNGRKG